VVAGRHRARPAADLAVFNRAKPRTELRRDLAVDRACCNWRLAYGLWTVHLARPCTWCSNRSFPDGAPGRCARGTPGQGAAGIAAIPWGGPTLLALREFHRREERMEMTLAALQGFSSRAARNCGNAYEDARSRVLAAARPALELKSRFPQRAEEIDTLLRSAATTGLPSHTCPGGSQGNCLDRVPRRYTGRGAQAYLPLDSF
jgi:hypothetical protein